MMAIHRVLRMGQREKRLGCCEGKNGSDGSQRQGGRAVGGAAHQHEVNN